MLLLYIKLEIISVLLFSLVNIIEVNELQVKEALDQYFQELLSYWNDTFSILPQIPFDESIFSYGIIFIKWIKRRGNDEFREAYREIIK